MGEKARKAQQINVTTIIILVLAVLVLLVVAIGFTGGWTKLWQRITGTYERAKPLDLNVAVEFCRTYFTVKNKDAFCNNVMDVVGKGRITCKELGSELLNITQEDIDNFCA